MPPSPLWNRLQKSDHAENTPEENWVGAGGEIEPKRMSAAVQNFGIALLTLECSARPNQNVFISPLSVFLALAMVENGRAERRSRRCARCWDCLPALRREV